MSNEYNYWYEELDNPGCNERDTDRRDLAGFWRLKGAKTKWDYALAIWPVKDGTLVAKFGKSEELSKEDSDEWNVLMSGRWLSAVACSKEDYDHAIANDVWPDKKSAVRINKPAPKPPKRAEPTPEPERVENRPEREVGIGHNMPPMGEKYAERLKAETKLLNELLKKPVTTEEQAEKVGECKNRIGTINKEATAEHGEVKAPHWAMCKKIDNAYNPTIKACGTASRKAAFAVSAYLEALQEELNKKAREEQAAKQAEADRQAREEAELAGEDAEKAEGKKVTLKKETASVGKAAGRAVSMRTYTSGKITDFDKLLEALKDRQEIKDVVQSLANRAAKSGKELPGMEIVKEKKPS